MEGCIELPRSVIASAAKQSHKEFLYEIATGLCPRDDRKECSAESGNRDEDVFGFGIGIHCFHAKLSANPALFITAKWGF